jgi:hypothetical protein
MTKSAVQNLSSKSPYKVVTNYLIPRSRVLLEKLIIRSARQEIICLLWNQKIHYRVQKRPPPVPVLSQMNPIHTLPSDFLKIILILSSHLSLGLPSGLFPTGLQTKPLYTFLISPCAACPAHLILLDLILLIIFAEVCKLYKKSYAVVLWNSKFHKWPPFESESV